MQAVEFKVEYSPEKQKKGKFPVVIVAAGNSSRMGGIDKQFAYLCGVPVIVHTMLAFERSSEIGEIIIVTAENSVEKVKQLADEYMITKLIAVVKGGKSRTESVNNGLSLLSENEFVLIHDGARPLVSKRVISAVCAAAVNVDGVVPCIPVIDTLKLVYNTTVKKTVDRSNIVSAQTPQCVNLKKYIQIIKDKKGFSFTDDVSVLESDNLRVVRVEGDSKNIKITRPSDLELAEFYLEKGV